ncbi:MAG TPA: hypothetical protein VJ783_11220 [Pirellulales bacterium]|nr:hypothetical protein [Pirellulales bacterium]
MRKDDCGAQAVAERRCLSMSAPPGSAAPPARMPAAQWLSSPRLRLQLYRRRQWAERRRAVPCWLSSLVLHLLAVVVLGSLAVPIAHHRRFGEMLLSFASGDTALDSSPNVALLSVAEAVNEVGADESPNVSPEPMIEPVSLGSKPSDAPPVPHPAAELGPPTAASDEQLASTLEQPAGDEPSPKAPSPSQAAALARQVALRIEANREENDVIVDRFIEFDIGLLRAEAGVRAKREFDRLGPSAIPSLVYGLNRAARIHASCPVVVLTSKLNQALQANRDPDLLRYALDHVGEDVPRNAPHYVRLQAFFDNWSGGVNGTRPFTVQNLLQSLQSRRLETRLQAAATAIENVDKLRPLEKSEVAWLLIRWLTATNSKSRSAAHRALVALAEGADLGPPDNAGIDQRQSAACRWSMHFDAERFEAAASSTLKTARHLEDTGHREAAKRFYRKIVAGYEGTRAAAEAAEAMKPVDSVAGTRP